MKTVVVSTLRPLDLFAKNFLRFIDDYCFIEHGIRLETDKYLSNVKVFNCTDKFWNYLLDLRATKMEIGDPNEYERPPQRDSINGLSLSSIGVHRVTGQRYLIPPEGREQWHRNTFSPPLARQFAQYDALIFLHRPERWAMQLKPENAPHATRAQFQAAKAYTIQHAPYDVTAHECLHLTQKITGGTMPRWDPTKDLDPAERLYDEYLDQLTHPVFEALYLRQGTQADELDL